MKTINKGSFNLIRNNSDVEKSENSSIQILGNNNEVFIESRCSFKNLKVIIKGDNNKLHIKRGAWFLGGAISIMDTASVTIGERSSFGNRLELVAERAAVNIGNDCKIDSGLLLRTTDIHGVYSLNSGKVVNTPKNIEIGDYVWIRRDVSLLKGAIVASCNLIESRTVFDAQSDVFEFWAGYPAVKKENDVVWSKSAHLDDVENDKYAKMYIDKYRD